MNNPRAFPNSGCQNDYGDIQGQQEGMTLLDYFAGIILKAYYEGSCLPNTTEIIKTEIAMIYNVASYMLEEREKHL